MQHNITVFVVIIFVINLYLLGDGFYIAVGGGIGQHGWCHVQNILQDKQYNVKFEDHSEKMGMLSVQGPKRYILTQKIIGVAL